MKNTKVSEIMSTDLVTVNQDQPLLDVKSIFEKHHLRHVPVTNKGKLVGIISLLDFMRVSFGETDDAEAQAINENIYKNVKVEQVMIENPMTLSADASVEEAAELFDINMFHSIPVVDDGQLKGIVTTIDMIRYLRKVLEG